MKRCPQCGRDYTDETLSFCLDDGASLLDGPASMDEPETAILPGGELPSELPTRMLDSDESAAAKLVSDQTDKAPAGNASRMKPIVAGSLGILLITALVLAGYWLFGSDSSERIESIAVMPFRNESGNVEMEYLSDGMTESLISGLSQITGLNVKARSTVFRYKGTKTDAKTIGKELGVQAVLNGRLVLRGDQLTLSLELIDAENENLIWNEKYERRPADLISLQSEIARDVSDQLKLKLTSAEQLKLAKRYTEDPEVYRLYLQGRFHWNKRSKKEVAKAVALFQQAVERDPDFALGYVGLADSNEDEDRPQKLEYIRRALVIDPDLAEAHASLGYQLMCRQDWVAAEQAFEKAKELNPKYAQAYAWNGIRMTMIGKYDEALAEIDRALAIEPTANGINFYKAVTLLVSGQPDAAVQKFKKMQQTDPTFSWIHYHLAREYSLRGDTASAAEEHARAVELDGDADAARRLREAFKSGGWKAFLAESKAQNAGGALSFGETIDDSNKERVLASLQRRAEVGDFWLFLIKTDPRFDPIRTDARFNRILMKFEPPLSN